MVAFLRSRVAVLGLVILGLGPVGCKTPNVHEPGLRNAEISQEVAQTRSAAKGAKKEAASSDTDHLLMSDRAKQISRDLQ